MILIINPGSLILCPVNLPQSVTVRSEDFSPLFDVDMILIINPGSLILCPVN